MLNEGSFIKLMHMVASLRETRAGRAVYKSPHGITHSKLEYLQSWLLQSGI